MLFELQAIRDPELEVLEPSLIISQGREPRWALEANKAPVSNSLIDSLIKRVRTSASPIDKVVRGLLQEYFAMLRMSKKPAVWLNLVHPSERFGGWALMQRLALPLLLGWLARNLVSELSIP